MLLVYTVDRPCLLPLQWLIPLSIWKLKLDLSRRLGRRTHLQVGCRRSDLPQRLNAAVEVLVGNGDSFRFCFSGRWDNKCIYLHNLRLPVDGRSRGTGSWVAAWMKGFARRFGYKYILVNSLPEAEWFWRKQGFKDVGERLSIELNLTATGEEEAHSLLGCSFGP